MSLVKCPRCHKRISPDADVCVRCGQPGVIKMRNDEATRAAAEAFGAGIMRFFQDLRERNRPAFWLSIAAIIYIVGTIGRATYQWLLR